MEQIIIKNGVPTCPHCECDIINYGASLGGNAFWNGDYWEPEGQDTYNIKLSCYDCGRELSQEEPEEEDED